MTMMLDAALSKAQARARAWLWEAFFPLWAQAGPDPRGGFRERLSLDGGPIEDAASRVRVQARQTYVFAQALLLGWSREDARPLVERGVETLLGPCRRADGVFGKIVAPGRGLLDDTVDLYDNAFALFALSWAAKALQCADVLQAARDALAAIEGALGHDRGGFHNSAPPTTPRLQNPHMHMFEALLALHAASGEEGHLGKAAAIAELCATRFVTPGEGRLRERFTDDWSPFESAGEAAIEPGHELEWCWLWGRFAARRGAALAPIAGTLYAAGVSALDARGLAPQTVGLDGAPRDASRRTWPQTEAVKAHVTMAELGPQAGRAAAADAAATTLHRLFEDYLDPAPAGGWIDHYDADGRACARDMPASTGYHVLCALAEVMRVGAAI